MMSWRAFMMGCEVEHAACVAYDKHEWWNIPWNGMAHMKCMGQRHPPPTSPLLVQRQQAPTYLLLFQPPLSPYLAQTAGPAPPSPYLAPAGPAPAPGPTSLLWQSQLSLAKPSTAHDKTSVTACQWRPHSVQKCSRTIDGWVGSSMKGSRGDFLARKYVNA